MPALVKVLKYLRDNPGWADFHDVIIATRESQTRVEKALVKLTESGIIESSDGNFRYLPTEKAEDFSLKFLGLYAKIIQEPQMEMLVRGLLVTIGHPAAYLRLARLLEVMEKEGFNRDGVALFLEREAAKGRIEKLHIIFISNRPGSAAAIAYQYPGVNSKWLRVIPIPRVPYPSPLAISTYYMSSSRDVSAEEVARLREEYLSGNSTAFEEEYILGIYPSELSEPAVKYLTHEKGEILRALKEEAFQQWFGLRYSW